MAKTRSPNYPQLSLGEAIEAIRPVLKAENRNKMSRAVLAKHLGYSSLNGRALTKIGAIRAFGLIDGSGDDLRVSDDAVSLLLAPEGSSTRELAKARAAMRPALFKELRADFPTTPSPENLQYELVKRGYTQEAAGKAAETYLATMRLVGESEGGYNPPSDQEEGEAMETPSTDLGGMTRPPPPAPRKAPPGSRQAVFPLSEGDVTMVFPAELSAEGYRELRDYLDIFLRKAQREHAAKAQETFNKADDDLSDLG